jgi:nuclear pore complex protein Nup98-Nup96
VLTDASLSAILPNLTRPDYYTEPSLTQLAAMARDDPSSLSEVANFTVGRRGVGAIRWLDPVDVRGLDLDTIVNLSRGSVEVYLDEEAKPEVGQGLNRPAEVTMLKVFKIDKESGKPTQYPEAVERFTRKLKKVAAEQGARFVMYDGGNGTWKFEVEHFSKYGLVGEESDDEEQQDAGGGGGAGGGGATTARQQVGSAKQDFGRGGDRAATMATGSDQENINLVSQGGVNDSNAVEEENDEEDDEDHDFMSNLGVKGAKNKKVASKIVVDVTHIEQGPVVAEKKTDAMEFEFDGEEERRNSAIGRTGGVQQQQRAPLQVSLPEMMDVAPEDLLRIRSGLYPTPTSGGGGGGVTDQQQYQQQQRRIEVDIGAVGDVEYMDMGGTTSAGQQQAPQQQQQVPQSALAVRNTWRKQSRTSLRPLTPPSTTKTALASSDRQRRDASLPALPSGPMPASPAGAARSPCPVAATPSLGKERCIPDTGLFLGSSFKVGWAPNGVLCSHANAHGGSLAQLALSRVLISSGVVANPNSSARRDVLRKRMKELLRVHYENSLPDAEGKSVQDVDMADSATGAVTAATSSPTTPPGGRVSPPRWRLQCSRREGSLRELTQKFIQVSNEHASAVPGPDFSVDRTVLRHQAAAWELVHALFSSLPAEEESDDEVENDGDESLPKPDTSQLAAMQRRAELSKWLRERSRGVAERAAHAAAGTTAAAGQDSSPDRVLALLSGHQLASATAAAATSGDVRLASLLATAGSSSAAREQLASQLNVWRDAGFEPHLNHSRRQVYQLLAGQVDTVIPALNLDWRRALGCHIWYGCPPGSSVAEAVAAYEAAVEGGTAPPPLPLYLEHLHIGTNSKRTNSIDHNDVFDVNFELLRLFCTLSTATAIEREEELEQLAEVLDGTLSRLLRPAGITPDPLDYSFIWHMLCVLRSIGAVPEEDVPTTPAPSIAQMNFISQLENLGGLSHWAVYVALHLPDPIARETTVRELLARHCPEWAKDQEVIKFLIESLDVPKAWVAEAKALWAKHTGNDVEEMRQLIDAGDLGTAHRKFVEIVAPAWLLSSTNPLSKNNAVAAGKAKAAGEKLVSLLMALEDRAAEIDDGCGSGTWHRGGALYAAFLGLSEVYTALTTRSNTVGNGASLPSYEQRMDACGDLADRLNDASAALAVAEGTAATNVGSGGAIREMILSFSSEMIPLRRAALARMTDKLSQWVMSDAQGDSAVPGPSHAAVVSGLRSLRDGKVAAAVQMGAVSVASVF